MTSCLTQNTASRLPKIRCEFFYDAMSISANTYGKWPSLVFKTLGFKETVFTISIAIDSQA